MLRPPFQAFGALQRLARRISPGEQCELCGKAVAPDHEHLVEPGHRRLLCACQACAILFSGQVGQRYRRVPRTVRSLPGFRLTDDQWNSLMVPINMAFFFRSSKLVGVTAIYPSPAGPTESLLSMDAWNRLACENPELLEMEPEVEALLINRLGPQRGFPVHQYFLLPIDQCFKLAGLVRSHWRGLSGGEELWGELGAYFASLSAHAATVGECQRA